MIYKLKCLNKGVLLSQVIEKSDINFSLPCSGLGTCGKCKIKIIDGEISEISVGEKRFLSDYEIKNGYRLACFTKIYSDVTVEHCENKTLKILKNSSCEIKEFKPVVKAQEYAISIDIGTTTIVINLHKGDSISLLDTISDINNQIKFGADVISRIDYSISNTVDAIHKVTINQLNQMIKALCHRTSIDNRQIKYAVVTGNTTMLHFFANINPESIAFYPFTPKTLFGYTWENNSGLAIATDSKIYLSPCISAYIGADLVCAVLVSDMLNKEECSLLVDIGTNGEMALHHNGGIKCCSTAAGPVFEGVGIELGSSAIEGAISSVYFNKRNNSIDYKTINNEKPIGICGTGVIDAVSVFLSQGIIDDTGKILKEGHNFSQHVIEVNNQLAFKFDKSNIYITQKDIRQIQLAKGAIAGGINALLVDSGVSAQDIDRFYICGGFGSYINLDSAENIGLIPKGIKNRTVILGNAALNGASAIILDNNNTKECAKIAEKSNYIELSTDTVFADEYIKAMSF